MHYTATTTPPHGNYNYNCATPLHPAVVGGVTAATTATTPKEHNSNHLSAQWIRSGIRDSQQPTSPIGFLFLKLPPPPCAVPVVDDAYAEFQWTSHWWPVHVTLDRQNRRCFVVSMLKRRSLQQNSQDHLLAAFVSKRRQRNSRETGPDCHTYVQDAGCGGRISECQASKILGRVSQVLSWVGVNNSYAGFGRRGRCCIFVILSCHFLSYLLVRCLKEQQLLGQCLWLPGLKGLHFCHGDMLLFWFV